jgi:hypothetical protein
VEKAGGACAVALTGYAGRYNANRSVYSRFSLARAIVLMIPNCLIDLLHFASLYDRSPGVLA